MLLDFLRHLPCLFFFIFSYFLLPRLVQENTSRYNFPLFSYAPLLSIVIYLVCFLHFSPFFLPRLVTENNTSLSFSFPCQSYFIFLVIYPVLSSFSFISPSSCHRKKNTAITMNNKHLPFILFMSTTWYFCIIFLVRCFLPQSRSLH